MTRPRSYVEAASQAEVRRLTPTERLHEVTMQVLQRRPSEPECSVTVDTTVKHASAADPEAKRLHTWQIVVRGTDPDACQSKADELDAHYTNLYAHELNGHSLEDQLRESVKR